MVGEGVRFLFTSCEGSFVQSKVVNDNFSSSEISSFLMPIGY